MTSKTPDTILSSPSASSSNVTSSGTVTPSPKSSSSSTSTSSSKVASKKKKTTRVAAVKHNDECPIFLRKTYHMVDTCDPAVASWSEDGETFVVKNTEVFEKEVIPQFFKHSKFTSFVRQLNFYGFRKIKYCDTIKIDAKLEAETANFWRFRHDKFLRGRPELLIEIKRSNGQQHANSGGSADKSVKKEDKPEDVVQLKSEVSTLKERIASMTKNIDDLTVLVQNMAVKPEPVHEPSVVDTETKKRKKNNIPTEECRLDDNIDFRPGTIFPSAPNSRQQSMASEISDQEFVDDLFTALDDDMATITDPLTSDIDIASDMNTACSPISPPSFAEETLPAPPAFVPSSPALLPQEDNTNTDPILMKKLSDALGLLPKDIQEMLVNRLVTAITNTDAIKTQVDAASTLNAAASSNMVLDEVQHVPDAVPDQTTSFSSSTSSSSSSHLPAMETAHPPIAVPLAAATLGALLAQYGSEMKKMNMTKSLPIIPAHA